MWFLLLIGAPVCLLWAGAILNLFGESFGPVSVALFILIAAVAWKRTILSAGSSDDLKD